MTRACILFPNSLNYRWRSGIRVNNDGSPDALGFELAKVCRNIVHGADSIQVVRMNDGLAGAPFRVCKKEQLSAMVLGMLFARWDAIQSGIVSEDEENIVLGLQMRFSHLQFESVPELYLDSRAREGYKYVVAFKDYGFEVYGKLVARRPWIEIHNEQGLLIEGWPEDVMESCGRLRNGDSAA
ncbi:hypothetical protein HNP46_000016 [Pseudomonas nitritireducens]|uniref:Uncharacterized protein n=1 Tax=Pseudomonas nitroreducens TaxID=46680 RepID=A0A7W7KE68_PSENT|nr:hypothetical protein [Pseudomonas nitritireducens]MBB4861205.1 hypothetical protein [Pseudomonas nitritireducens]